MTVSRTSFSGWVCIYDTATSGNLVAPSRGKEVPDVRYLPVSWRVMSDEDSTETTALLPNTLPNY